MRARLARASPAESNAADWKRAYHLNRSQVPLSWQFMAEESKTEIRIADVMARAGADANVQRSASHSLRQDAIFIVDEF